MNASPAIVADSVASIAHITPVILNGCAETFVFNMCKYIGNKHIPTQQFTMWIWNGWICFTASFRKKLQHPYPIMDRIIRYLLLAISRPQVFSNF